MDMNKARRFAIDKHSGQTRKFSGEPYSQHCLRVADTVSQYTQDKAVIVAALLHDTLEDTQTTNGELIVEFGARVANMVRALTNDESNMRLMGGKREYLASKVHTLTADELLIKLADRLDNVADLRDQMSNPWSRKYCEETRYVFLECLGRDGMTENHLALLDQIEARVDEYERLVGAQ